jgi:hypothetical protein
MSNYLNMSQNGHLVSGYQYRGSIRVLENVNSRNTGSEVKGTCQQQKW